MFLVPDCSEIRGHCAMELNNKDFMPGYWKILSFNPAPPTVLILNIGMYEIKDLMKLFLLGKIKW